MTANTSATQAIKTVLDAAADVQALVGNGDSPETYRLFPILAPQQVDKPYIVYHKIAGATIEPLDSGAGSGNGTENLRYRFTCWDGDASVAQDLAKKVQAALMGATTFEAVNVFDRSDHEIDTGLYSISIDFSIWYK